MRSMERLLRPGSIAVVGGGWWCANVIAECRKIGFSGDLWVVHPTRSEVAGCKAVASIAQLPVVPDAAFVGINRHASVDVVRQLSAQGAGGAVCFASGFSEAVGELADGDDLQVALVAAAGDMPVLGPNCYGFINALDGAALWPDQHGLTPVTTGAAIISQSSNIALNLTMQTRGLPIAYLMTVGNQAQSGLSAIGQALLSDERVTAIGLHIEGIDDLAAFEAFARRAHALGKRIVALKVGTSEEARAVTVSHTAALAGSAAGAKALFARLGIAQVDSLAALIEALKLLHVVGPLPAARIASLSCSGGEASLMADMGQSCGIAFPPLGPEQKTALNNVLGPQVALSNPLDYHTYVWGNIDAMRRTYCAMMAGEAALGVVVLDIPRQDRCDPLEWLKVLEAITQARDLCGKPMAILATLPEGLPEALAQDLLFAGIVPFCGMREALEAIAAVARASSAVSESRIHVPPPVRNPVTLEEHASKECLRAVGLKLPRSALAGSPAEAAEKADAIGYPVVLKGAGIAHKTEAGAVALNLRSAEEVEAVAAQMPAGDFLVEELVTGTIAELLVGIVRDPAHGLVLTLAAGGVLAEVLEDRTSLLLPVSRDEIAGALEKLKIATVLKGYRGNPPADLDSIIDAVTSIQDYALGSAVVEVEINPLICGADFAVAADALIICGEAHD